MAWTPSVVHVTGDAITAAIWNSTVGMANSPVVAKATLTADINPFAGGQVVLNSTSAQLGYVNGPLLSTGMLVPQTAGIYHWLASCRLGFAGTITAFTIDVWGFIGGVGQAIGEFSVTGVSWTGSIYAQAEAVVNMPSAGNDECWMVINYTGGSSVVLKADPATYLACSMIGVL